MKGERHSRKPEGGDVIRKLRRVGAGTAIPVLLEFECSTHRNLDEDDVIVCPDLWASSRASLIPRQMLDLFCGVKLLEILDKLLDPAARATDHLCDGTLYACLNVRHRLVDARSSPKCLIWIRSSGWRNERHRRFQNRDRFRSRLHD